jgi:hypothetical protein
MKLFLRTTKGRVVYDRKKHLFEIRDAVRILSDLYDREINNSIFVKTDDEKKAMGFRWRYVAEVSTRGLDFILKSLESYKPGEMVAEAESRLDKGTLIFLIDVTESIYKIIKFLDDYAGWVPFVGETAALGMMLMKAILLLLGPMPSYHRNDKGEIVIDYP